MKKKILSLVFLSLFLTSCAQNDDTIQEIHIQGEDFLPQSEDNILPSGDDTFAETGEAGSEENTFSAEAENFFDENNQFQEYSPLAVPISVSGITFIGKENDRYLFAFPDDAETAGKLYNEYGALIQHDGFTLEEYEGNYIICKDGESVAFMGTGYNTEHKHILMIAFYPDKE